jgi:hypothetical protein
MKKSILLVLLLAASGARGWAGESESGPDLFGPFKPKVGKWAKYDYETKKGKELKSKMALKWAVVGKEGDDLWIEQTFTRTLPKPRKNRSGAGAMKMLIGADHKPKKMFYKSERGVMDMTNSLRSAHASPHSKPELKEEGTETIEVPAGKFKATRYSFRQKETAGKLWAKEGTGPYGALKTVMTKGDRVMTMVLLDSGDGAKAEIDVSQARSMGPTPGMPEAMGGSDMSGRPDMAELMKKAMERRRKQGQDAP